METQDPLAQLNDIILPSAVHSWPITLGWWLLLLFFIALAVGLFIAWKIYQKQQKATQLALLKWQALEASCNPEQVHEYLTQINQLLKQTALNKGYAHSANLSGKHWLDFLASTSNLKFNTPAGELLAKGIYQAQIETQYLDSLHQLCGQWIKGLKKYSLEKSHEKEQQA